MDIFSRICRRCSSAFPLCRFCDGRYRYCSNVCGKAARRDCVREAGRVYQESREGRRGHAARQQKYRDNRRDLQKVTHQRLEPSPAPLSLDGATGTAGVVLAEPRSRLEVLIHVAYVGIRRAIG